MRPEITLVFPDGREIVADLDPVPCVGDGIYTHDPWTAWTVRDVSRMEGEIEIILVPKEGHA